MKKKRGWVSMWVGVDEGIKVRESLAREMKQEGGDRGELGGGKVWERVHHT